MACAWLHPAITWTNVDLQFPWAVVLYIEFKIIILKIRYFKLLPMSL